MNSQKQLPIKKEIEIENSIEDNSEEFIPNEELDQPIVDEIIDNKDNIPEPTILDPKTVHSIRDMVVSTSGTMLNTLFKDEGFNYKLTEDDFTLIIKDEFYRIFIETKVDEISEKLSSILKKDINFSLVTGENKKVEKSDTNDETNGTINKLKNIFNDELIIK